MRGALAVLLFVLLLRLPFLNQAIQGDDGNYLNAAMHAQVDPAHPTHFTYIFLGDRVTMQGHPHPPLNAWFLAALLALFGDVYEVPYHAAYLLFSFIAALAALSLARRFTRLPMLATLLFLAAPAFVVNGTSLESDLPFVSLWLASIALFVRAVDARSAMKLVAACAMAALAAMTAFQSIVMVPILGVYLWLHGRDWKPAWAALAVVPATLGGWQLFERLTSERIPAEVLAGYLTKYGFQSLTNKLQSAAALMAHAGWLALPLAVLSRPLILVAAAIAGAAIDPHPLYWIPFAAAVCLFASVRFRFLDLWIAIFFCAALAIFFSGSARYLLPMGLPIALIAAQRFEAKPRVLWGCFGAQLAVSLALAIVNYQHWDGYRRIVQQHEGDWSGRRVWINAEWRYYAEAAGGIALERGQPVRPGDIVLSSRLALPIPLTTGGGALVPVSETPIRSPVPLRLIGLGVKSGFSSKDFGYRPFDIHAGPLDIVKIETVVEKKPTLSFLPMNAPEADHQIVSGVHGLEEQRQRWMAKRAVFLLKSPGAAQPVEVDLYIPDAAPARAMTVDVDGVRAGEARYDKPGRYQLRTAPVAGTGETVTVSLELDRAFSVPGDQRELGVILVSVGFRR